MANSSCSGKSMKLSLHALVYSMHQTVIIPHYTSSKLLLNCLVLTTYEERRGESGASSCCTTVHIRYDCLHASITEFAYIITKAARSI